MFHQLSHIYAKTLFYCIETVANNALNCQRIVVLDRLWTNATPTLNTAFSLTNVHAKLGIHCLLISLTPLLSHATLIYEWAKWVFRGFGVFWDNYWIWSLNNTYQAIVLLKLYFSPSETNSLSTEEIQIFPLFWKFATIVSFNCNV